MKLLTSGTIITLIALVVIALIAWWWIKKGKEGYADVQLSNIPDDKFVTRGSFKANLAPRFDPHVSGGYIKGPMPADGLQGAPLSATEGSSRFEDVPDFASLTEGLSSNTPEEYDKLSTPINMPQLRRKRDLKTDRPMLEYTDPSELLPTPDASFLSSDGSRDPSDPSTYVYDRYLFAKLKPRNVKNIGDSALWIRGDLPIKPLNLGWFVPASAPSIDLVAGSMSQIADLDTSIDLQDLLYENKNAEEKLDRLMTGAQDKDSLKSWGKMWDS